MTLYPLPGAHQDYSIGKAAGILKVPVPTLRDWMNAGKVKGLVFTPGGHRRIGREAFLRFARARGIKVSSQGERRRAPRVSQRRVRLRIKVMYRGQEFILGEGRLKDLSRTGFQVDRLKRGMPFVPAAGTRIVFEAPYRRGVFGRVSGQARVAWSRTSQEEGASLGAELKGLDSERARRVWESALASGSAN